MRSSIALVCLAVVAGCGRSVDKRLLGKWKSDRDATLAIINRFRDNSSLDPEQNKGFTDMLGKLEIEYTATEIHATLGDFKLTNEYTVVAKGRDAVAIKVYSTITEMDELIFIRFEGTDKYRVFGPYLDFPEVFRRIGE